MMKTVLYQGEDPLGEVEIFPCPQNNLGNNDVLKKGMMSISHYSQSSERCPPLAVLHSITSLSFKMMESAAKNPLYFQQQDSPLFALHSTCLRENKTAVVRFGEQEIHLVAMFSRRMDTKTPCFWGFCVASGLYNSCVGMLNLRCLAIVFDLDETLVVANTMRSFEDRIDALQKKISVETDLQRLAGMLAEVKRYQDDKAILKQYAETDQVVDNGKVLKTQAEVVPALSDNHQTIVRPLIRLQDRNIVLTRINPQIRDTSVLVRLRPAWEDLRSYLSARGRKRFEVYVCTMAERDYALEMWRLLDPDSNLISMGELPDRIVCVKSGLKKSLFNVFDDGSCHPRMALVIDDRLKVWDEKDQPRVHVVPAFAPYYAPQAEANNAIPVLCVARNVACNVRGGFFKDFDDGLLQQISEVAYEDDLKDIHTPDVTNYLLPEDDGSSANGNKDPLSFDGMADAEVERRLKEAVLASSAALSLPSTPPSATITVPQPAPQAPVTPFHNNLFPQASSLARPLGNFLPQGLIVHNSPAREEGEVPESELDPDTRRRLLILQHGLDMRENLPNELPFSARSPVQAPVTCPPPAPAPAPIPGPGPGPAPRMQPRGNWFPGDDHLSPGTLGRTVPKDYHTAADTMHFEKQRPPPHPYLRKMENFVRSERPFMERPRQPREAPRQDDRSRSSNLLPSHQSFQGDDISLGRSASSNREFEAQLELGGPLSETPVGALHDIAVRCGTKVEFKAALVATTELKFSIETSFAGEKIGEASGVTRREAQHRAAESSLMNLADRYLAHVKSDSGTPQSDTSRGHSPNDMGFSSDANSHALVKNEMVPSSELSGQDDSNVDGSKRSMGSVSALKELCMREGFDIYFSAPPSASTNQDQKDELCAEVEIDGQVLGKGSGLTWDEAKMQAAERAFAKVKSMLGQFTQRRPGSPRSFQGLPSKRFKSDCPRGLPLQRMQSSRYRQNMSPVP